MLFVSSFARFSKFFQVKIMGVEIFGPDRIGPADRTGKILAQEITSPVCLDGPNFQFRVVGKHVNRFKFIR